MRFKPWQEAGKKCLWANGEFETLADARIRYGWLGKQTSVTRLGSSARLRRRVQQRKTTRGVELHSKEEGRRLRESCISIKMNKIQSKNALFALSDPVGVKQSDFRNKFRDPKWRRTRWLRAGGVCPTGLPRSVLSLQTELSCLI